MSEKKILIVEDDEDIASALGRGFARNGYLPSIAYDTRTAFLAAEAGCTAAIVDVMLGEESGANLVKRLRREGYTMPIIMLSALSSVDDRASGLAAGADDYVAKPFELSELLARVRVQEQRRVASHIDGPSLDQDRREVVGKGRTASLTQREFDLFNFMMERQGQVLSRGEIFDALWLNEGGSSENVVDVYIGYLRRKLSPAEAFGVEIKTMRSRGFILDKSRGN